jgi:hypothetical protein
MAKGTVKTGLTVDVSECHPELLPRSPKFTSTLKILPL